MWPQNVLYDVTTKCAAIWCDHKMCCYMMWPQNVLLYDVTTKSPLILSPALWYMAHNLSLSWKQHFAKHPIVIEICGNKTGCETKTNGYLIFNYSNLDIYAPQCPGFWLFVITHFNVTVLTFCGWFELNGMSPHGWQHGFTKCPAIVQTTLRAVKECLSFSEADCRHVL